MTSPLNERYRQLVLTVLVQLEQRNPYNVDHCRLVASYSEQLARHLKFSEAQRTRVVAAAEVHTLGVHLQMEEKRNPQGVPITALGLRTGREKSVQDREAEILDQVLGPLDEYRDAIPIIMARHDWYQGQEDKLSPEARVMAVVDAFVDLATPKSHRDPLTLPEVLSRLQQQSGVQFDPRYVDGLAEVITSEQEQWGAGARARQFETARYRHWLSLGNFHRQAGEADWALRSYRKAMDIAQLLTDPWLRIQATFGIFMVHHRAGEYERARDLLQSVRPGLPEGRGKVRHWFMLMWGMLIATADNDANGEAILEEVVAGFEEGSDLPGVAAARIMLARMSLAKGADDPGHLKRLSDTMSMLAAHDLFDIVVQFRPQIIPLLINAMRHRMHKDTATDLLTRIGEPVSASLKLEIESAAPTAVSSAPAVSPVPPAAVTPGVSQLRISGLGPLLVESVTGRATEEDWPVQKAMRLFALLAFRRGSFPDAELMEIFWGDRDEAHARGSLRNAIHQIRSVLSDLQKGASEPVNVERHRRASAASLAGSYWLDTEGFESGVSRGTKLVAEGQHQAAADVLSAALALVRGEFLAGSIDEWAEAARTHYSELHIKALQMAARCRLHLNDPEAAELLARQAVRRNNLREDLHVLLIESLLGQRRKGDALRHYHDAVALFRREIGLTAPAELTAWYDRIVM